MTMSLFGEPADLPPRRVTLVKLAGEIARSLVAVGRVAVEGEVYRPTTTRGGSVYFTLRDRAAQMSVKVPAPAARRSRIVAGERVSVLAQLEWQPDRGQLQLVAEEVLPVGAGAVAALIEEVRARLAGEGLIGRPPRPLPLLPAAVGVVCGADAAVRKDIESVVAARCPGYPVVFCETTVSGPGASVSIVEAIGALSARAGAEVPGVEVIVLARGGGDAPSLLPWSTEEVCRAVAACPVPVVSAIGHESDRPLCDEVADHRYGTPSLAAGAVLPDMAGLARSVDSALEQATAALQWRLEEARRRVAAVDTRRAVRDGLDAATSRLERAGLARAAHHPARALREASSRLAAARAGCRRSVWEELGRAAGRLTADVRHLEALSPQRTLERGYAVVTDAAGAVLRDSAAVAPGERIRVRLASGAVQATVTEVENEAPVPAQIEVEH